MAKIYIKSHKEPFDIPYKLAEQIKTDWLDDSIPRTKKISFSYFVGTLGDIKSFDMRSEREVVEKDPNWSPLTKEEREYVNKKSAELGLYVKTLVSEKTAEERARKKLETDRLLLIKNGDIV